MFRSLWRVEEFVYGRFNNLLSMNAGKIISKDLLVVTFLLLFYKLVFFQLEQTDSEF